MADSAAVTLPGQLKQGPKPKTLDPVQLSNLARLGLPKTAIADYFRISRSTLQRKLAEEQYAGAYEEGLAELKASIAQKMQSVAIMDGNPQVLMRLAEHFLGWGKQSQGPPGTLTADIETTGESTVTLRWTPQMDAEWDEFSSHEKEHNIIDIGPLDEYEPEDSEGGPGVPDEDMP